MDFNLKFRLFYVLSSFFRSLWSIFTRVLWDPCVDYINIQLCGCKPCLFFFYFLLKDRPMVDRDCDEGVTMFVKHFRSIINYNLLWIHTNNWLRKSSRTLTPMVITALFYRNKWQSFNLTLNKHAKILNFMFNLALIRRFCKNYFCIEILEGFNGCFMSKFPSIFTKDCKLWKMLLSHEISSRFLSTVANFARKSQWLVGWLRYQDFALSSTIF